MTTDEAAAARLGQSLVHMIRRVEDAQERAARAHGMHPTDFRCIGYLRNLAEPVSPKDIIGYLGLTSGSGTALLDRLEQAGIIRRLPNPQDRRSLLVVLDLEAAATPVAVHDMIQEKYRQATSGYSAAEMDQIARYLDAVTALSGEMSGMLYDSEVPASAP